MIGQQQKKKKKPAECYHSPFINNSTQSRSVNIKSLIEDIKYLQTCVTTFQSKPTMAKSISMDKRRTSQTPKKRHPISNSKEKKEKSVNSRKQYKQLNFNTIARKQPNNTDSHHSDSKQQRQRLNTIQKNEIAIGKIQNPSESFVLLQMENLKLEKQNLFLQNQLLDQQLQMERRQKQLLKNRLKKIQMNLLCSKDIELPKIENKNQKTLKKSGDYMHHEPNKPSLMNIAVPQFNTEEDILNFKDDNDHNKLQYSNSTVGERKSIKKSNATEEDPDSLLISKSESFCKQSFKENQDTLQDQFWKLLGQCDKVQSHQKWQIRQAMGNIANKLKTIRKH